MARRMWHRAGIGGASVASAFAALLMAAPTCAAMPTVTASSLTIAFVAIERRAGGRAEAGSVDEMRGAVLAGAAESWETVKDRLESRNRRLFREEEEAEGEEEPAMPMAARREAAGVLPAPETQTLPEEPPLTPLEDLNLRKAQALRRFENEQKFDVERDLRDFLDTTR